MDGLTKAGLVKEEFARRRHGIRSTCGRQAETAWVEASGAWEKVATIHATTGATPVALSEHIMTIINASHGGQDLLNEALAALEAILDEGLTYSTEQEADLIVARIKSRHQ